MKRGLLVFALLGAAAALGVAVSTGWTQGVDSYTVAHLWPWRACPYHPQSSIDQLVAPLPAAFCHSRPPRYSPPGAGRAAFAMAGSASPAPAVLVVAVLAALCVRGRRSRVLVAGGCGLVGATLAELIGKHWVTRSAIERTVGGHSWLTGTAHTFPCGHTARTCLVAYLVAAVRPRWRVPAVAWLCAVNVSLVATSGHTLTDVGGGLLVGAAIVVVVDGALGARPQRASAAVPVAGAATPETAAL